MTAARQEASRLLRNDVCTRRRRIASGNVRDRELARPVACGL